MKDTGKFLAAHHEALTLLLAERHRQVHECGYDDEHDDKHDDGAISVAAAIIALPPALQHIHFDGRSWMEKLAEHVAVKYPGDRVRQLSIAGALILAEMERRIRAGEGRKDGER